MILNVNVDYTLAPVFLEFGAEVYGWCLLVCLESANPVFCMSLQFTSGFCLS